MKYRLCFWLILIIGLSLRLYHAWTAPYAYANSDSATLWLMAKHILDGEFPLFFYGQYYLGPLEALTIAFFFMLFGIKISTLFLGTIFYSILFMISAYYLGRELKDRTTGLLMMLYSALPPPYFFRESIAPLGYHIEILFLGNIMLILALKIPNILSGMKKTIYFILLGFFGGIGVWTHYIILYYLVPIAIYLILNEKWKSILKNSVPAAISFFLIGLPFWIFTFKYNFATFKFKSVSTPSGAIINFLNLLGQHFIYMFNIDNRLILVAYIILILFFLFSSFSNKKYSIMTYFFISILLFYVSFRSKVYAGGGYNCILPILTFVSAAFSYFCRKFKMAGFCLILLIISTNAKNVCTNMFEQKNTSNSYKQIIYDKIKFLEDNKTFRFIGHEGYGRVPVFFSNERIIATGFMECRYPPFEDIVESSDRIAFEKTDNDWIFVLNNICGSYSYERELFYNFKPFKYRTRMIRPTGYGKMRYGCDRDYNTFWINRGDGGFVIDLGKSYRLCKIELFNGHHYGKYPPSCRIQTSLDGRIWKDTVYIESTQPLFWSGPRLYWHPMDGRMQWFISPVEARFVRLTSAKTAWEINEVFVYEYIGDEIFKVKDYVKDAKNIVKFLVGKNINFTYADFWLSARIKVLSRNKVEALVPYNSFLPLRKNMSREIRLAKDKAFIVRVGDTEELEGILKEFSLPFRKINFRYYACYFFPQLKKEHESISSLMWVGVGVIKHSLKDYSNWLYNEGYYEKALRYYPNNFMAYIKCKILPAARFISEISKTINFINDVEFLGYSIRNKKIIPGKVIRIEYFWKVHKELKDDLSIFVYFIKEDKIFFQNDHKFLYQFGRPLAPLNDERFREVLKLIIPEDTMPGIYQIIIGLWDEKKQKRICIKDPSGRRISKQVIGELVVSNEA